MENYNLITLHHLNKKLEFDITVRINSFKHVWEYGSDDYLLLELLFCLLTPQSNAVLCWEKALELFCSGKLYCADVEEISTIIHPVRFKNNKAQYIKKAVSMFGDSSLKKFLHDSDIYAIRDKIVTTVEGIGYKEASHFLRNIGIGLELAILDRHILNCLLDFHIIDKVPNTLTPRVYKDIECKMLEFCKSITIPMAHLDFIFWYLKKGTLFK
ncbi:MAG: DNA lyase [Spirochaetes bacterium]|nr:DNA lyase [Spirochaetota bacterium]